MGWSNQSFDMLLKLLKVAFPIGLGKCGLGIGYESIHVHEYNCILYWKEIGDLQQYSICGESQYNVNDDKGKEILCKILHHFPINELKQMFCYDI